MNISEVTKTVFKIGLIPIYIYFWVLVIFKQHDPSEILTVSISVTGALCALSFTAYSSLKTSKKHQRLYLFNLSALNFFKATVLSVIALLSFYFTEAAIDSIQHWYHKPVEFFYGIVGGLCYGGGIVNFHYGLMQAYRVTEESF